MKVSAIFFIAVATLAAAQRPFYAGSKPIGYPELADRFRPLENETSTTDATLDNRFGEDGQTTTTVRLPVDALGDKNLIDRISKWPVDKQPFWYINWKLIEAQRQQRPYVQQQSQGGLQQNQGQFQQPSGQPLSNFNQPQNYPSQSFAGQPQPVFYPSPPNGFGSQGAPQNIPPQGSQGRQWRNERNENNWRNYPERQFYPQRPQSRPVENNNWQ